MRPRVFPAEDEPDAGPVPGCLQASMRPRVFPAEDARAMKIVKLEVELQ